MKTRIYLFILFSLLVGQNLSLLAQQKQTPVQVKIEEDAIFFNTMHVLNYEKISLVEFAVNDLNNDELISYRFFNNETPEYRNDDYFIIYFTNEKMKVESTNFSLVVQGVGLNFRKNTEKLLTNLLKFKVLDENGEIDSYQLEKFVSKYDEYITERTIRY